MVVPFDKNVFVMTTTTYLIHNTCHYTVCVIGYVWIEPKPGRVLAYLYEGGVCTFLLRRLGYLAMCCYDYVK